jgi:hypothetical protein
MVSIKTKMISLYLCLAWYFDLAYNEEHNHKSFLDLGYEKNTSLECSLFFNC